MTRPEELAREACMVDRIRGGPTNIASRADVAAAIRKAVGEALGELAPHSSEEWNRIRAIRDRWLGEGE